MFIKTPELFILIPILLNLKGNLEMNLAARFSTSVLYYTNNKNHSLRGKKSLYIYVYTNKLIIILG